MLTVSTQSFTDYALESGRMLNETSKSPGYGNVTLKRVRNGYPKIFAEMELIDDLKNYDVIEKECCHFSILIFFCQQCECKAFYSPLGNQRYILLPLKVYRQPVCKILNNEYRYRAMHDLHKYSNFPFSQDRKVDLCDLMPPVFVCPEG